MKLAMPVQVQCLVRTYKHRELYAQARSSDDVEVSKDLDASMYSTGNEGGKPPSAHAA